MPRMRRYNSHDESSILADIDNRQQSIDTDAFDHAIVVGIGGIGSWVALDLALSGNVETLHIIDPDVVESTNLNRTPFRLCDIKFPKVDAMKYLILERRAINIKSYRCKTNPEMLTQLKKDVNLDNLSDVARLDNNVVIVDCRDDAYEDMYDFQCKYYKLGYDGLSITVDGNPRNTAVWGQANNYRFTPSFIAPAQMVAAMIVTDILTVKDLDDDDGPVYDTISNPEPFDILGRINKSFTIDSRDILGSLYREYLEGVVEE